MRALTPDKEQEVARRYSQGATAPKLAIEFEVSTQTVCNILERHGVAIRKGVVTDKKRMRIVDACRQGATVAEAAKRAAVSKRTATRIIQELRRDGVDIRLPRGPRRAREQHQKGQPSFKIEPVSIDVVEDLCSRFHGYRSAGQIATYAFAVIEDECVVAAYAWQPPPLGAARTVCPEAPAGVLALSRMVAVPREERRLRHISKPLRHQMLRLIDRTRWPVLITYSDEGQGHTGHVYKCSGWESTVRVTRPFYVDSQNRRVSIPTSDNSQNRDLRHGGATTLQRWEQWACPHGEAMKWMIAHGWKRIAVPGRVWRSGNPVFTWIRE